ncbi:transcriptional regulator, GntR family [Polaromonas sp. YR568]|uniref:GntR family transcriptional regulator n=1 Tax=Polaromonas sp. YR568 TaxID=1855301 RepID=UPI0008EACC31|nr:GntR family transcriptional regulator [Polaromonas sp. YR568]SFU35932.1 transcriptional regulator, GntR family [Polaromonas sp. YR568]
MSSQIDYTTQELRRRILSGQVAPGERMVELELSAQLAVSRTPIRIALGELEKEGLLERLPTRGFRVRQFSVDEITNAVDVRGVLEGMAARQAAERGITPETRAELQACIDEGRLLLDKAQASDHVLDAARWVPMNARFHDALVQAAGNSTLASALAHVSKTPMAGAGALSLNGALPMLEFGFIQRAQSDHEDVLAALLAGEGARAEALMREHAHRSRDNKRELITRMQKLPA